MSLISVSQHITDRGRVFVEIVNCSGVEPTAPQGADSAAKHEPPCSVVYALRASHPHLFYFRGENDLINTFNSNELYDSRQTHAYQGNTNEDAEARIGVDRSDAVRRIDRHPGANLSGRGSTDRAHDHAAGMNVQAGMFASQPQTGSPTWSSGVLPSTDSIEAISERVWSAHGFQTLSLNKSFTSPVSTNFSIRRSSNTNNNNNNSKLASTARQQYADSNGIICAGSTSLTTISSSSAIATSNTSTPTTTVTTTSTTTPVVQLYYSSTCSGNAVRDEVSVGLRPQLVREKMPEGILLPGDRRLFLLDIDDPVYLRELFLQKQRRHARTATPSNNYNVIDDGNSADGSNSHATTMGGEATVQEAVRFDACRSNLPQAPLLFVYYERLGNGASCADIALKWFAREQRSYNSWCDKYIKSIVHIERQWQLYAIKLLQKIQGDAQLSARNTLLGVPPKPSLSNACHNTGVHSASGTSHTALAWFQGSGSSSNSRAEGAALDNCDSNSTVVKRKTLEPVEWLALLRQRKEISASVSHSLYRRIIPPVLGSPIRWRRNAPNNTTTAATASSSSLTSPATTAFSTSKGRGAQDMQATRVATVTDSTDITFPLWYYYDSSDLASLIARLAIYYPTSMTDWVDVLRSCSREFNAAQTSNVQSMKPHRKSRGAGHVAKSFTYDKPVLFSDTHTNSLSKSAQKMFNMKQSGGGMVIAPLDGQALLHAFDCSHTDSLNECRDAVYSSHVNDTWQVDSGVAPSSNNNNSVIVDVRGSKNFGVDTTNRGDAVQHGDTMLQPERVGSQAYSSAALAQRRKGVERGDVVTSKKMEDVTVAWVENNANTNNNSNSSIGDINYASVNFSGTGSIAGSGGSRRVTLMQPGRGLALLGGSRHSRSQSLQMVQKQQQLLLRLEQEPPHALSSCLTDQRSIDEQSSPSQESTTRLLAQSQAEQHDSVQHTPHTRRVINRHMSSAAGGPSFSQLLSSLHTPSLPASTSPLVRTSSHVATSSSTSSTPRSHSSQASVTLICDTARQNETSYDDIAEVRQLMAAATSSPACNSSSGIIDASAKITSQVVMVESRVADDEASSSRTSLLANNNSTRQQKQPAAKWTKSKRRSVHVARSRTSGCGVLADSIAKRKKRSRNLVTTSATSANTPSLIPTSVIAPLPQQSVDPVAMSAIRAEVNKLNGMQSSTSECALAHYCRYGSSKANHAEYHSPVLQEDTTIALAPEAPAVVASAQEAMIVAIGNAVANGDCAPRTCSNLASQVATQPEGVVSSVLCQQQQAMDNSLLVVEHDVTRVAASAIDATPCASVPGTLTKNELTDMLHALVRPVPKNFQGCGGDGGTNGQEEYTKIVDHTIVNNEVYVTNECAADAVADDQDEYADMIARALSLPQQVVDCVDALNAGCHIARPTHNVVTTIQTIQGCGADVDDKTCYNMNDNTNNNNGVSSSGNATSAIENVQFIYLMTHEPLQLLLKIVHRMWNRVDRTCCGTTSFASAGVTPATNNIDNNSNNMFLNVSFTTSAARRGLQHMMHFFTPASVSSSSSFSATTSCATTSSEASSFTLPTNAVAAPTCPHSFPGSLYVEFVIALLSVIINAVTMIPVTFMDRYGWVCSNARDVAHMLITQSGAVAHSLSTFVLGTVLEESNVSLIRTVFMPILLLFSSVILLSSVRHVWYPEHDVYFMYDAR